MSHASATRQRPAANAAVTRIAGRSSQWRAQARASTGHEDVCIFADAAATRLSARDHRCPEAERDVRSASGLVFFLTRKLLWLNNTLMKKISSG
jgi:hypothetical protein